MSARGIQRSGIDMRAVLRQARFPGGVQAKCRQRAREALQLAQEAREQGFPNAMREYVNEAREYRRIGRSAP